MIAKLFAGALAFVLGLTGVAGLSFAPAATPPPQTENPQVAWIGAVLMNVGPQVVERLQLDVDSGVVVARVFKDSPAEQAGLQVKDIVKAVGSQPVENAKSARQAIAQAAIGQPLAITVQRGGQEQPVTVTPTAVPGKVKVVQNVAKRLIQRGVARRNARRDQLLPGWGDIPKEERFSYTLSATFRYKDMNGNVVTVQTIPGVVVSASATSLTITPNDPALSGGPFAITESTAGGANMASLQPGDEVRVVTADGQTALAVIKTVPRSGPPAGEE